MSLREKIADPQLSLDGAKLLVLETNTCSQTIPLGHKFSVCQPSRCGFSRHLSSNLMNSEQCHRTNPRKLQPLGIRDTRRFTYRGASPFKLQQDCSSGTRWELLDGE
jgi:hypothetical protein